MLRAVKVKMLERVHAVGDFAQVYGQKHLSLLSAAGVQFFESGTVGGGVFLDGTAECGDGMSEHLLALLYPAFKRRLRWGG